MNRGPIDTHAHIDELLEPEEALDRAAAAGVEAVVGVGMDLVSNRRILELAQARPGLVWPALGAHPWNIKPDNWLENHEFLSKNLSRAVALGEVGLDWKVKVKRDLQKQVLDRMLALASTLGKPVLFHSRFSQAESLEMLVAAGIKRAVFHWYSGPIDLLKKILDAGFHVSATPALAYRAMRPWTVSWSRPMRR